VKEKMEQIRNSQPEGSFITVTNRKTVTQLVTSYLEMVRIRLKPSTIGIYKRMLDKYISPYLGDTMSETLTLVQTQEFANSLIESGLAVSTVKSIVNLIKSSINPTSPEIFAVQYPKHTKHKSKYFSVEEQKLIEQAAKSYSHTDYIVIMLCLYTGVRIGEVCGLRWDDIDYACKTICINRTIQRIPTVGENKTEVVFLAPKSTSSAREIPLADFLIALLHEYQERKVGEYLITYKGKPLEPRTLQYRFKRILKIAGVKNAGFHSTRHTFAARALENGFDVKSLSEILGHGSATVTLNRYAHASAEHKRNCMNSLSNIYSEG
jgi:integrase